MISFPLQFYFSHIHHRIRALSDLFSELEDVSSEDEERGNIWLRSLLRSTADENSPSSSMFVEIGSPTFSSQEVC